MQLLREAHKLDKAVFQAYDRGTVCPSSPPRWPWQPGTCNLWYVLHTRQCDACGYAPYTRFCLCLPLPSLSMHAGSTQLLMDSCQPMTSPRSTFHSSSSQVHMITRIWHPIHSLYLLDFMLERHTLIAFPGEGDKLGVPADTLDAIGQVDQKFILAKEIIPDYEHLDFVSVDLMQVEPFAHEECRCEQSCGNSSFLCRLGASKPVTMCILNSWICWTRTRRRGNT